MKHSALAVLLSLSLLSCATTLRYSIDYPLTESTFGSRDGTFSGRVPYGWFSSDHEELPSMLVSLLIKSDFSATLAFRELQLDELSRQRVSKEGLRLLAYVSAALQKNNGSDSIEDIEPQEFELRGKPFCSYEIRSSGNIRRVVLFDAHGKFYECEARMVKANSSLADINHLYTVQQTLLFSLIF